MNQQVVLVLAGPTASGKSELAVDLAEALGGEIVGADAFQMYRGLPILSAQPEPELRSRVPHHLIGILEPGQHCTATEYAARVEVVLREIASRDRLPILVGGTGFYLRAVTHGLDPVAQPDPGLRTELRRLSLQSLVDRLLKSDPTAGHRVDLHNPVRVARAIEIMETSGHPLPALRDSRRGLRAGFTGLWLSPPREALHQAIKSRVRHMFEMGVVEEVLGTADHEKEPLARTIGFHHILEMTRGACDLETCLELVERDTRRYARRQCTWFRNRSGLSSMSCSLPPGKEEVLAAVRQLLPGIAP